VEARLTGGVKGKVRPGVIEEALLRAHLDCLNLAREAGRGSEFLQTSHKLDHAANEGEGDLAAETVVDAIAERLHRPARGALLVATGLE
jgi:hypothetical protein